MELIAWFALALSLAVNIGLLLVIKAGKKRRRPDTTAQDLLHDLTRRGAAVVRVEVLDPSQLLLRSPRS